jgi:hypothetical protein
MFLSIAIVFSALKHIGLFATFVANYESRVAYYATLVANYDLPVANFEQQ